MTDQKLNVVQNVGNFVFLYSILILFKEFVIERPMIAGLITSDEDASRTGSGSLARSMGADGQAARETIGTTARAAISSSPSVIQRE